MKDDVRSLPPQNIEAEQAVLGAVIFDSESLQLIKGTLRADDFYRGSHRKIFAAMIAIAETGEPIDVVTLSENLKRSGDLDNVGGLSYLAMLANEVPTSANIEVHGRIIRECSLKRSCRAALLTALEEITSDSLTDVLDGLKASTIGLMQGFGCQVLPMKEIVKEAFRQVEARYNNPELLGGIPSGFPELDDITDGWHPGELIIVAGRPGKGKSVFGLNIACSSGVPAGFISLEMSAAQLGIRGLASASGAQQWRLRKGLIVDQDWPHLVKAASDLAGLPVYFSFTSQKITDIERTACELVHRYGVRLLVVDYLQRVSAPGTARIREQEVSEISRTLKGIAMQKDISVIALAQLNRQVENRTDKKPTLADLRESGAIEADADVVILLSDADNGLARLTIAKGRSCGTGEITLRFNGDLQRFENL